MIQSKVAKQFKKELLSNDKRGRKSNLVLGNYIRVHFCHMRLLKLVILPLRPWYAIKQVYYFCYERPCYKYLHHMCLRVAERSMQYLPL